MYSHIAKIVQLGSNSDQCFSQNHVVTNSDVQRSRSISILSIVFLSVHDISSYISVMPNFAERVEMAVDALSQNPVGDIDENEFIDASRLVYDGVRDIRQAVLMNRVRNSFVKFTYIHDNFKL